MILGAQDAAGLDAYLTLPYVLVGGGVLLVLILVVAALLLRRRPKLPAEAPPDAPVLPGGTPAEVGVIDAADPGATPRRAVTIPSGESDSGRASEQTLKRMTLEQIESATNAPKPPRAGEIPENPLLPDGPVKIRCLACEKKMRAEGAKFMKQRRCPHCKAEPFRYSIVD